MFVLFNTGEIFRTKLLHIPLSAHSQIMSLSDYSLCTFIYFFKKHLYKTYVVTSHLNLLETIRISTSNICFIKKFRNKFRIHTLGNLVRVSRWLCTHNLYANFRPWLTRHPDVNKRISPPDLLLLVNFIDIFRKIGQCYSQQLSCLRKKR